MQPILETDRLVIRRLTEADVDALVALDSDPQVTFFITGGVTGLLSAPSSPSVVGRSAMASTTDMPDVTFAKMT